MEEHVKSLQKLKKQLQDQDNLKANMTNSNTKEELELISRANCKEKFGFQDQLKYLKSKDIDIGDYKELDAKKLLSDSTYYYKLTAYRKNFYKKESGKYENLSLKKLKDLSTIDMYLRYLVLSMTLDLEHTLKTALIKNITLMETEDGYQIVEDFNKFQKERNINFYKRKMGESIKETPNMKDEIEQEYQLKLKNLDNNLSYTDEILRKCSNRKGFDAELYNIYKERAPIWVIIEIMTYANLVDFIYFYFNFSERKAPMHKKSYFKKANQYLKYSKNIRNSAAHSRPVIYDIVQQNQIDTYKNRKLSMSLRNYAEQKLGLDNMDSRSLLSNWKVHDLLSTIYLHDEYIVNSLSRKQRKKEMLKLLRRVARDKEMYKEDNELQDVFDLFVQSVNKYKVKKH